MHLFSLNLYKINALFLAFAPLLRVYVISWGMTLAHFIAFLLVLLNIFFINTSKIRRINECILLIGVFFITILNSILNLNSGWFDGESFVNNQLSIFLVFLSMIMLLSNFDKKLFCKVVGYLGLLASIICIFQQLQYLYTGSFINNFFIPGLELGRPVEDMVFNRPSAFFSEPAHFAIFIIPIFYYFLVLKNINKAFILALGIISSGSTFGFLMLVTMCLCALNKNLDQKFKYILIFFLVIVAYFVLLLLLPDFLLMVIFKLTDDESVRMFAPLSVICSFHLAEHLYGIGINQMANYVSSGNLSGVLAKNYANAILYMYISYGIVGLMILLAYLKRIYIENKKYIGFFLFVLGVLCSDQVLFNFNLLYIVTWVYASKILLENCIYKNNIL